MSLNQHKPSRIVSFSPSHVSMFTEEIIHPKNLQLTVLERKQEKNKEADKFQFRDLLITWDASCPTEQYEEMVSVTF